MRGENVGEDARKVVEAMRDGKRNAEGASLREFDMLVVSVLHSMPPNNCNRGEDGSPKSALFGDVNRARWSSQSQVFVMKENWRSGRLAADFGTPLTRELAMELEARLVELGASAADSKAWAKEFEEVSFKTKDQDKKEKKAKKAKAEASEASEDGGDAEADVKSKPETKKEEKDRRSLVWPSRSQLVLIAESVVKNGGLLRGRSVSDAKNEIQKLMAEDENKDCPDGAFMKRLCGSMSPIVDGWENEGVMYVSHAMSADEAVLREDYFAAIDYLKKESSKGSAHIGVNEFSSSVVYSCFAVDVGALFAGSKLTTERKREILSEVVRAMLCAIPGGRRNKMFADVESNALVQRWKASPLSMVNAFLKPVSASRDGSTMDNAWKALVGHSEKMEVSYGKESDGGVKEVARHEFGKGGIGDFCDKVANAFIP